MTRPGWRLAPAILLGLIAAAALLRLRVDRDPLSIVAGCLVAGGCLWLASRWRSPIVPLALGLALRIAALALVHPPIVSDWARYEALAEEMARTGPAFADVPTGLPMVLGAIYAVVGVQPLVPGLLNLALGLATIWLVHRMAGPVPAMLLAILPAHVLMTTLPATEVPYAFALTLVVWLVTEHRAWSVAGLAVGLSQYLRSTAELVAVVIAATQIRSRRALGLFVAAAVLVLVPVIGWNAANGRLSASTSSYLGWQVLIGTNQATDGRYNDGDLALAGPGALSIGIGRITADPVGFARLAVRKFAETWGDETYAAYWTVGEVTSLQVLAQLGWVILTMAAFAGVLARRPASWAPIALVAAFAVLYTFTESQGRYHFYLAPLLTLLAAKHHPQDADEPLRHPGRLRKRRAGEREVCPGVVNVALD